MYSGVLVLKTIADTCVFDNVTTEVLLFTYANYNSIQIWECTDKFGENGDTSTEALLFN
jgi:hypothetical protein